MARKPGTAHQQLGATLGPRLAQVVSMAVHDHMRRTAKTRAKIGTEAALGFFRTMTAERMSHTRDFMHLLLGHKATPPEVEKVLRFMADGQGELSELLGHQIVYNAIGTGISSGIANFLAPLNQQLMHTTPNQLPGPAELAALAASGIITQAKAEDVAEYAGMPSDWTKTMVEQARSYPGVGQVLDMYFRGLIEIGEVRLALTRAGLPPDWHDAIIESGQQELLPADLALMVLKGIIPEADAARDAEKQGLNSERFGKLVLANGEPPGMMQLLEAYRRHFIDEARLTHGIRQSRIRDEWMDVILKLRYEPPSTSDAIRGVVQKHLDVNEARKIADENGLEPGNIDWLIETAGNPPSDTQLMQLWNRGHLTRAQAEQGMREGRLKDKYIKHMVNLRERLPEGRQVVTMITRGAMSEHEGASILHQLGYSSKVVQGLIRSATSGQVAREKELAKAEVQELWYEKAITEDEAIKLLKRLGYSDHNARLVIEMVNLKRETALRRAAMSPVRSAYISRKIDETQAHADLAKLSIPHEQITLAMELWTIDRDTHTKQLTEAQIVKANTLGLLSDQAAEDRLMGLGYDHGDARLLLDMEKNRTRPAP